MNLSPWNHPVTAERYRIFTERHDRYREAARALVEAATIAPGHQVLDMAAGIGCTALACLELLGPGDSVTAVEVADAMRTAGETRTKGLPVDWRATPPDGQQFDRVLCGAAIWAMGPAEHVIASLVTHVAPGGVLAVSLPAAYLGEADTPGGGADPWLTGLPAALASLKLGNAPVATLPPVSEAALRQAFLDHGFAPSRTGIRLRQTQAAYCDWMTLPPVNDTLLGQLAPEDRPAIVAKVAGTLDLASWRWETWALFVGVRQVP